MAKKMQFCALISAVLTVVLSALYLCLHINVFLFLAITAGTFFYHFGMRLTVGTVLDAIMRNRANAENAWFRPHAWESKLYARLGVRKWRKWMPTYDPTLFSTQLHPLREILGANCQAEVVHEIIAVLSFVPLLSVPFFGEFPVFLLTSLLAALYDMLFVLMQRYARPHLLRAYRYTEQKKEKDHDQSRSV